MGQMQTSALKVGSLVAGGIIGGLLLQLGTYVLRYQWQQGYFRGIPRVHDARRGPIIFRRFSDQGEVERITEELLRVPFPLVHQGFAFGGFHLVGLTHPDDLREVLNQHQVSFFFFLFSFFSGIEWK